MNLCLLRLSSRVSERFELQLNAKINSNQGTRREAVALFRIGMNSFPALQYTANEERRSLVTTPRVGLLTDVELERIVCDNQDSKF